MLSPRLKNLVSNRSPLKEDKKNAKHAKNQSVDLKSAENVTSSRTSPRRLENKVQASNATA